MSLSTAPRDNARWRLSCVKHGPLSLMAFGRKAENLARSLGPELRGPSGQRRAPVDVKLAASASLAATLRYLLGRKTKAGSWVSAHYLPLTSSATSSSSSSAVNPPLPCSTQPSKRAQWKRGNVKVRRPDFNRWGEVFFFFLTFWTHIKRRMSVGGSRAHVYHPTSCTDPLFSKVQ